MTACVGLADPAAQAAGISSMLGDAQQRQPPTCRLPDPRTVLAYGVHAGSTKPVLHGDSGATVKAAAVLTMLHWLSVDTG